MKRAHNALVAVLALAAVADASTFSVTGAGGSIVDAPAPSGTWSTGVYLGTPFTSTVSVANPATSITRITLHGFQHTHRGDLLIQLRDPNNVLYNVIVRPGFTGTGTGDSGDYSLGDYDFVTVGMGGNAEQGATNISGGTYGQYFNSFGGQSATGSDVGLTSIASATGGTWTLEIRDWAIGDVGSLTSWTLEGTDASPLVTSYCSGDGSGTACPCSNAGIAGHGCASSVNASGALLASTGTPDVSSDTFVLHASGMPNSSALYYQGTTQQMGGIGSVFGDGLRCAGGTISRLGTQTNVAGASQYPAAGDAIISVKTSISAAGGTRTYQCWYRNAATFCTASTFNLTNGLKAIWAP